MKFAPWSISTDDLTPERIELFRNQLPPRVIISDDELKAVLIFGIEHEPCSACDGTGEEKVQCDECQGSGEGDDTCPECQGSGNDEEYGGDCENCDGEGEVSPDSCDECDGDGEVDGDCTADGCNGKGYVKRT